MKTYLAHLRGVNVGGKNKVSMATLRRCLEDLGFSGVSTFIASGNVILKSDKGPEKVRGAIEAALTKNFRLDSELIKVLVLTHKQLKAVVEGKPRGFGEKPDTYHSDAIFLMDAKVSQAIKAFSPKEGVDRIWPGKGVIYSERLSAERTKSRLNRIMLSPLYKSMTIRNWNTTTKLLAILERDK